MYSSWWPAISQRVEKTSNENNVWILLLVFPLLPIVLSLRDVLKTCSETNQKGGGTAPMPPSGWRHWSTLWICFVFLYQTYQSPISLYPCSSINLFLTLIVWIYIFVCKQLSSLLLNSYRIQQHYGFKMHRAGQRCFELLALIGNPQLL